TVLNSLSFGQTDLVSLSTFIRAATAVNFDHQSFTRKIESRLRARHVSSQRPFTADELQVQTRDAVCANPSIAHHCDHFTTMRVAHLNESAWFKIERCKDGSAVVADVFGHRVFSR